MSNKPDLGEISKKLNIAGLVSNIKSMISPGGQTPMPEDGDLIGAKLAELSVLVQEIAKEHAEQTKRFAQVNSLFNQVFEDIKEERDVANAPKEPAAEASAEPEPTTEPEAPAAEAPAEPTAESPAEPSKEE